MHVSGENTLTRELGMSGTSIGRTLTRKQVRKSGGFHLTERPTKSDMSTEHNVTESHNFITSTSLSINIVIVAFWGLVVGARVRWLLS